MTLSEVDVRDNSTLLMFWVAGIGAVLILAYFLAMRWGSSARVLDYSSTATVSRVSTDSASAAAGHDTDSYGEIGDGDSDASDTYAIDEFGYALTEKVSNIVKKIANHDEEEDPQDVAEFIDDSFSSVAILKKVLISLSEVWGVLIFMYWSLLTQRMSSEPDELLACSSLSRGIVSFACEYTLACLHGFPVLAANVTLMMTIRTLIQLRIYYSMLSVGYVLDFANNRLLNNLWPWLCILSISQGGAHLLLKMYLEPGTMVSFEWQMGLVRKFVLPGGIFLAFFLRYAEIENVLIPLNLVAERDYTHDNRACSFLKTIKVLDERVIAYDARHRDVVGDLAVKLDRKPSLREIVLNMIDNYEQAYVKYEKRKTEKLKTWGLFKSLWPAAVLVDSRLDYNEPRTREWLLVFFVLLLVCVLACALCLVFFFQHLNYLFKENAEQVLGQATLIWHGILVLAFAFRTGHGMFYMRWKVARDKVKNQASELRREVQQGVAEFTVTATTSISSDGARRAARRHSVT